MTDGELYLYRVEEQNSILYLYSSIWRWSDSEPERVESIKKFCNFFDTILRFSFFDPDPESSCFGVSHYNGNVSLSSLLSTSCPGFFLSFSSLLSLFLALVRRETGRGVGSGEGGRREVLEKRLLLLFASITEC